MMSEQTQDEEDRPPVGNLTDFVYDVTDDNPLKIEVAINDEGKVILFYNKIFKNDLSWLEFDLKTNELDFVLDGGETRNFGMPLDRSVAKHMHNTHQVLAVLLDDATGNAKEGNYIPLILHQS